MPLTLTVTPKFAPVPDRGSNLSDKRLFTGHLWMMGAGRGRVPS